MSDDRFWKWFHEIYESIPRQGPGDPDSTARALRLIPLLTPAQRILDIGCGAGTQTLDLAKATEAQIVAIDSHAPFVAQLAERAATSGLAARISAQVGDMFALPFPDGAFDVIWAEGSIFVIGFEKGLRAWRRLLAPGGYMAVTEFCWFRDDPDPELQEMFIEGCPAAANVQARREVVAPSGYRLLADFVLPDTAWWDNYYVPLAASLERFRALHADEPEALAVAARSQRELELYLKHRGSYGYVFFVMQRDDTHA